MKAKDVVFKDNEIAWCWDAFDRILATLQSDSSPEEKLRAAAYYALMGLKGRQDFRED